MIIEEAVNTTAESGDVEQDFKEFAKRWASIEMLGVASSREVFDAAQVTLQTGYLVKFPYLRGLTGGMRLRLGQRIFEIEGIANPDQRNIEHAVTCRETDLG